MGLIHSSWGGTPIASWISGPTLMANSRLSPFLTFWQDAIARYPLNFTRYEQNLKKWEESGGKAGRPAPPLGPGNPHEPTSLYKRRWSSTRSKAPYGIRAKPKPGVDKVIFTVNRL